MLVLTRKANEQILIGDDIKITLVRVRGDSVRVGIEAPREVRVVRGELADRASDHDRELEYELEERESVFAHPQPKVTAVLLWPPPLWPPHQGNTKCQCDWDRNLPGMLSFSQLQWYKYDADFASRR